MCAHREPAYQVEPWLCGVDKCDCDLGSCDRLTESEQATERAIILPLFHQMTEQKQERAIALVRKLNKNILLSFRLNAIYPFLEKF